MMDTTKANDIFNSLLGVLNRVGVDWSRAVSIATDSAPSMIGKKARVATKFKEKVQVVQEDVDVNCVQEDVNCGHFTVFRTRRHCVASR